MKKLLAIAAMLGTLSSFAMTDAELFKAASNMKKETAKARFSGVMKQRKDDDIVGSLIQRHPLLNHARRIFKEGIKNPSPQDLQEGKTWICMQLTALDFQSEIWPINVDRKVSFRYDGEGIFREVTNGNNTVSLYALDDEDLAGINNSGYLYEAVRATQNGGVILESSVQGTKWYKSFFQSLISSGRNIDKLLRYLNKAMAFSVANSDAQGLVYDYSICPKQKLADGVIEN